MEIEIGDGPLTFILMLKSLRVGGGGCSWIIASALVLFRVLRLRLELDQDPSLTISLISWSQANVAVYVFIKVGQ